MNDQYSGYVPAYSHRCFSDFTKFMRKYVTQKGNSVVAGNKRMNNAFEVMHLLLAAIGHNAVRCRAAGIA